MRSLLSHQGVSLPHHHQGAAGRLGDGPLLQVSKRPVSKRLKRQVYKTSALQNVRFTKCQVYKTSSLQNVRLQKNIHINFVLVVGGNPQVLLQPCLQAKGLPCFILLFSILEVFLPYITIISNNDTLFTKNRNANLAIPILFV
jgi:hypothetical protein